MRRPLFSTIRFAVLGAALLALTATATNYTLWVKGRGSGGQPGNHLDFSYWGPASVAAGANKRAVNWDGASRISTQNHLVRDALDCYCTGPNWCHIAAYSAGDLMLGYTLALYGQSARQKKIPVPNASGQCSNDMSGTTQVGFCLKSWRALIGAKKMSPMIAHILLDVAVAVSIILTPERSLVPV